MPDLDAATPHPLSAVAALPGVRDAIAAARDACTELRWHHALRRRADETRAEVTARAARATAALDGAELPVDAVRDILRGALTAPDDAVGRAVSGALRATVEAGVVGPLTRTAPLQALARLHTAAAAGLVPADQVGRPRGAGESPLDLPGPGVAPAGGELAGRLAQLADLLAAPGDVPALVVAALAHAEVLTVRPFVAGNGVVARALFRAVLVERGLDPTGVALPEPAWQATGLPGYVRDITGYATGTPAGVARWVVACASAVRDGAGHGQRVADAVLAGRLVD